MDNLFQAKRGVECKISGYENFLPIPVLRRLCDLGLTEGESVKVCSRSLLKKALLVEVRGYMLSLKADIAKGVLVK